MSTMTQNEFDDFINFIKTDNEKYIFTFGDGYLQNNVYAKTYVNNNITLILNYESFGVIDGYMIFDKRNQILYTNSYENNYILANYEIPSEITIAKFPYDVYETRANKAIEGYIAKNYDKLKFYGVPPDDYAKGWLDRYAYEDYIKSDLKKLEYIVGERNIQIKLFNYISYIDKPDEEIQRCVDDWIANFKYEIANIILKNEYKEEVYNSFLSSTDLDLIKRKQMYIAIQVYKDAKTFKLETKDGLKPAVFSREDLIRKILNSYWLEKKKNNLSYKDEFENVKALIYKGKVLVEF